MIIPFAGTILCWWLCRFELSTGVASGGGGFGGGGRLRINARTVTDGAQFAFGFNGGTGGTGANGTGTGASAGGGGGGGGGYMIILGTSTTPAGLDDLHDPVSADDRALGPVDCLDRTRPAERGTV